MKIPHHRRRTAKHTAHTLLDAARLSRRMWSHGVVVSSERALAMVRDALYNDLNDWLEYRANRRGGSPFALGLEGERWRVSFSEDGERLVRVGIMEQEAAQ